MTDKLENKTKQSDPAQREAQNAAASLPADALILLPMRGMALFPGVVAPITVGRQRSVTAAQEAARCERPIGLLLQRDASVEEPSRDDLYEVGTQADIVRYVTAPDGTHHIICQGESRFRVQEFLEGYPFLAARVETIVVPEAAGAEIEARLSLLREQAVEALELLPQAPKASAKRERSRTSWPTTSISSRRTSRISLRQST